MRAAIRLAAIPVLFTALACTPAPGRHTVPLADITVTDGTSHHVFRVEVATTPAEIERGLQGRQTLAADRGMLLLAGEPRRMRMWMKDTPIPLDMLFFDTDGHVLAIKSKARPYSKRLIPSPGPVAGVLELPGGTAARLGIRTGDRVLYNNSSQDPGAPATD